MKRAEALRVLMRGVGEDMQDYRQLAADLESQFLAALRHDAGTLGVLAEHIMRRVDVLEARRRQRVALAERLAGPGIRMQGLIDRLPQPQGPMLADGWDVLEGLVARCKSLNLRNCRLMTEQHDLMQRVLGEEVQTYAPA